MTTMTDPLKPPPPLLFKLAGVVASLKEWFDGQSSMKLLAANSLLHDAEVQDWLVAMAPLCRQLDDGLLFFCAECGRPTTRGVELATGRVLVDGVDAGQGVFLCEEHMPEPGATPPFAATPPHQPRGCKRVRFRWPEPV
jgi:hypothetical protein